MRDREEQRPRSPTKQPVRVRGRTSDANKIEIRNAVEKLFSVRVTDVRTQVVRGDMRRVGRYLGRRPAWKKAIVTLQPEDSIEFFGRSS